MRMTILAAATGGSLAALSAIHLYWLGSGSWGKAAAIPERDGCPLFRPSAIATLAVAVLLLGAAWVVLLPEPRGCLLLAVVFAARAVGEFRYVGLFKRVRGTRFARLDTAFYSPLCLAIAAACAGVARGW